MKTNIISRLMLLVALLLTTLFGRAQSADNLMLPGANAHSLTSTLATHAGLHTGDLQVELPLLTLPGKGIDIPISLAFSSGGVDHTTEASCIGLGWSLKAGGVITATINGDDDWNTASRSYVPWQYDGSYIRMLNEQNYNNPGMVAHQLTTMANSNRNPDLYRYILPDGRSGDISIWLDHEDNHHVQMYPDTDCSISRTSDGYLITDNNGIKYYFEIKESNSSGSFTSNTAWFLSRIVTPEGGNMTFSYANESYTDYRVERDFYFPNVISTKRITRIDSEFGYILFNANTRGDMGNAKRISSIELYTPSGNLVKGYGLTHDYFETSFEESPTTNTNYRLALSSVYEFDGNRNALPSYKFTYDYYFSRGKDSYKYCYDPTNPGFNCMRGSWAEPASFIAIIDRNSYGDPACWAISSPTLSEAYGFNLVDDYSDNTTDDYFCLTQIELPTKGYEKYTYENHTYRYSGQSDIPVWESKQVAGKRLSKKTVSASEGSPTLTYKYIYKLHNADYSLTDYSSGILVNPSIHTSVLYTPLEDLERQSRLVATAVTTDKPQNSLDIPAICYTEVEEVITDVNTPVCRNIFYFGKHNPSPAMNYFYSNYRYTTRDNTSGMLVAIPNKIHGRQEHYTGNLAPHSNNDYTYMAYPVGKYTDNSYIAGEIVKQVLLNSSDRVVRKIENEYYTYETYPLFGYQVERYNEQGGYYNFAISQWVYNEKSCRLHESVVTDYFPLEGNIISDSIVTAQKIDNLGGRHYKQTTTVKGVSTIVENRYPDLISMGTSSNLTGSALAVKQMCDKNVIGFPIQQIEKHNGVVQSSTYHTYKQLSNGMMVPDSVYRLKPSEAGTLSYPSVNAQGKMDKNVAYEYLEHYALYSSSGKPLQINRRGEATVALDWGYNDCYITARAENCTYSALENIFNYHTYMDRLENFGIVTDSNRSTFNQINQQLRQFLPSGALLTTYTYDPLLGITSECNPSGDTIFYEYDSYGRLARTRNTNGEIIQEYEYHYAN